MFLWLCIVSTEPACPTYLWMAYGVIPTNVLVTVHCVYWASLSYLLVDGVWSYSYQCSCDCALGLLSQPVVFTCGWRMELFRRWSWKSQTTFELPLTKDIRSLSSKLETRWALSNRAIPRSIFSLLYIWRSSVTILRYIYPGIAYNCPPSSQWYSELLLV